MKELTALPLNQKMHGTFFSRPSEPKKLMRIESRDYSNFTESYQISQPEPKKVEASNEPEVQSKKVNEE